MCCIETEYVRNANAILNHQQLVQERGNITFKDKIFKLRKPPSSYRGIISINFKTYTITFNGSTLDECNKMDCNFFDIIQDKLSTTFH